MRNDRNAEEMIVSEETRAAHHFLLRTLPTLGLTPSQNSGFVRAVRLHDVHNRYLFSWVPAKAHLLFYIRKPALAVAHRLERSVAKTSLPVETNRAGELKVRVEREGDARRLAQWLAEELPLRS